VKKGSEDSRKIQDLEERIAMLEEEVHVLNNVSVKSGVELTISAENVVIHGAFETKDGVRLEVKNP